MRVISTDHTVVTPLETVRQQRMDAQLKQLEFHALLHRKLDLIDLLESFLSEAQAFVRFDGVKYVAADRGEDILAGDQRRYRLEFDLELGEQHLGDIVLLRGKPFTERDRRDGERLAEALLYPLQNALAHHEATMKRLTDGASGLQNQEALLTQMPRDIRHALRIDEPMALVLLTVDYLESITEHHGSQVGDQAWHAVADALQEQLRDHDGIYRTEHDEFLIVLPRTDLSGATALARRLQKEVDRTVSFENVQFVLSASVGITELDREDDMDSLCDRALEALSLARRAGRNQSSVIPAPDPVGGEGPTAA